jgi:RNA polymerase sigma-B factor
MNEPPPGPDERLADEPALLERYHRERDPAVQAELVERFLPLARRLASRYRSGGEPMDDLVQVASMGLVKAIERFDPERGASFSSYAVPTILGELKRHFRDQGWAVHVPRELQERAALAERAVAKLTAEHGRAPSVSEIAARLELGAEEVLEAMDAAGAYRAVSLDIPKRAEDDAGMPVAETIGEEEPGYDVVEYGAAIEDTLEDMPERDREVLRLRFVEDLTQTEIADRIGVSQMHVSRIIRRAVERLRREVEGAGGG